MRVATVDGNALPPGIFMHFTLVFAALASLADQPARPPESNEITLLIMPVDAKGTTTKDDAQIVGTAIIAEVKQYEGFRISTLRDVEQLLTQDMRKQLLGCDSESCAAEIAGAMNAQQLLTSQLGTTGGTMHLTVCRIEQKGVKSIACGQDDVPGTDVNKLIERLPATVGAAMAGADKKNLFGSRPRNRTQGVLVKPVTTEKPSSASKFRMPLRIGGVVGVGVALAALVVGVGSGVLFGALLAADRLPQDGQAHHIPVVAALVGNVAFYAWLGVLPVVLLASVVGGAVLASSWLVP